jgi:hypothetical protein
MQIPFFSVSFINSNWLYNKPIKLRERLGLVRGIATAAARAAYRKHCSQGEILT